jgi:selenocysteine-specific elongation factor
VHIVVGTAGHIDHGKSALVLALTGTDPDRLKEEKARGITIDLGFAHQTIDDVNFSFVDVPGHERFVKNMLAGAGGIDLVILIVAADESVMPQTREHFDICRLLRVPAGVIALTKADLVDADTLELAEMEVRELVAGSALDGAPIVAVSAKTGQGLDQLRAALIAASHQARGRAEGGVARLPIDRVFSMKGFGTVVTGTLVSGRMAVDDELLIAPGDLRVKVRGVQVHGEKRQRAVAGERTAINLAGVDVEQISRGQALVTPGVFEETRLADATIELLPGAKPLKHGARVRFHQGTAEIMGRVSLIGPAFAPSTFAAAPLRLDTAAPRRGQPDTPALAPGDQAFVRLRLEAPAILARGDRYILRAYSPAVTIAGGLILDPRPPRTAIRAAAALTRCRQLMFEPASGDRVEAEQRALAVMIDDAGRAGLPMTAMTSRAGVDPERVDAQASALVAAKLAVRAGDVVVASSIFAQLKDAIARTLTAHHKTHPLSEGIPREELREQLFARGHAAVFDRALSDLSAADTIFAKDRVALATHRVELTAQEGRAHAAIARAYHDGGHTPPDAAAVAAAAGAPAPIVERMLKLLQRQKTLVKVDALLFHEEALKQLKTEVAALKSSAGTAATIDVATFKGRFGVSRKFAIPLLEYLDRERVTRRMGENRIVL